jgi:predicted nucleic acid-binding protein
MAWLLDKNILSELRRPNPHPGAVAFIADCPLDQLFISVVTVAEIRSGLNSSAIRTDGLHWKTG